MMLLVAGLCLCGCEAEQAGAPPRAGGPTQLTGIDDCSLRLHDVAGYLLQYYTAHHELPQSLQELQPMAGDRELPLTCPVSGKPYQYHPDGLVAAAGQKQLLLVDPEPSHNGHRWAIVTMPPSGKTPLGLWVIQLKEVAVQQFHAPRSQ